MSDCLRYLHSLSDAEQVLVCAGGTDWRTPFTYGLAAVLVVGLFLAVGWLALRAAR